MHCLGAVTGGVPSPNGAGSRGSILSVFRALGVLVCEGRIQGPPRGYKEGPHCTPPMQALPNSHVCEKDSYLCERYLILVREITDRIAIGSYLCVEVVLCSDCPCGLAKATCKHPVCPVPSLSISPWQQSSEMLLEYWCICVVASNKSPETMNFQGLYQAVRSRLHFSQVAAWWSRSNGAEPSYITTRVIPYSEDNLRKFRETPVEHTFPLAAAGDGTSIKVTVWALPRMEEVPILSCSIHPRKEKDEESVARALTPTKAIPVPMTSVIPQNLESHLVMPGLVDDRLQTPCDKPGKHHCRCEEEDNSPPSPSIQRSNGERKRRRSLPCGPAGATGPIEPQSNNCVTLQPMPSVQESMAMKPQPLINTTKNPSLSSLSSPSSSDTCFLLSSSSSSTSSSASSSPSSSSSSSSSSVGIAPSSSTSSPSSSSSSSSCSSSSTLFSHNPGRSKLDEDRGSLERSFTTQLSLEGEGNVEKRYKRAQTNEENCQVDHDSNAHKHDCIEKRHHESLFEYCMPFDSSLPWSFVESWNNSNSNLTKCSFQNGLRSMDASTPRALDKRLHDTPRIHKIQEKPVAKDNFGCIDPYGPNPFHESNPGPSTHSQSKSDTDVANRCFVRTNTAQESSNISQLMSKLSFPDAVEDTKRSMDKEEKEKEGGLLDWFSKVPGRVLGVTPSNGYSPIEKTKPQQPVHGIKFKNCNLELSQREFDEVLAVLRARTPSGRRRTPVRTIKKRDRLEKTLDEQKPTAANGLTEDEGLNYHLRHQDRIQSSYEDGKKSRTSQYFGNKNNMRYPYQPLINNIKETNNEESSNDRYNDSSDRVTSTSPIDCLQNKADVLLSAILRTSKEQKGNVTKQNLLPNVLLNSGTRPRIEMDRLGAMKNDDMNKIEKEIQIQNYRYSFDNEKSLQLNLHKRFHRFRQLFKKEQQHRVNLPTDDSEFCQEYIQKVDVSSRNRVKRRIDLSGTNVEKSSCENSLAASVSTNSAHSNSIYNDSTNYINKERINPSCEDDNDRARNGFLTSQQGNSSSKARHSDISNGVDLEDDEDEIAKCVEDDETIDKVVPSAIEQERFRRSLENAASMVFHSRTGLPLTSSPAPLRRGSCCFDYDSSLNSVSSKRSALFELNTPPSPGAVSLEETDRETENPGEGEETPKRRSSSRGRAQSHALLGSFEESALNGRLEPVSTVHGFTAELGASGSFCPKHRKLPVTVFFYTLGDNDKVSTPYLAHINLGKKGYQVPRSGTIQVTLLNPLGTVVKMFVVLYDLSDMPPRSHTFLRQRTLRDKTLRYLVHLRFMSGKSGRIYLHTDIRMIICRKSDVDTASDFGSEPPKELRSYTHGPTNPKFSPRC